MNNLLQFALQTLAALLLAGFLYLGWLNFKNWFCTSPTIDALFRKIHKLLSENSLSDSVFTVHEKLTGFTPSNTTPKTNTQIKPMRTL